MDDVVTNLQNRKRVIRGLVTIIFYLPLIGANSSNKSSPSGLLEDGSAVQT